MVDFLIKFNRDLEVLPFPDFWEKTGDVGCGLLHLALGKTVNVVSSSNTGFREAHQSLATRIVFIALSVLIFPVTLVLSGVGSLGYALSQSRKDIFNIYHGSALALKRRVINESNTSHLKNCLSVQPLDITSNALQKQFKQETKITLPHYEHFLEWQLVDNSTIERVVLDMVKQELMLHPDINVGNNPAWRELFGSGDKLQRLKQLIQSEIINRQPNAFPATFLEKIDAGFLQRIDSRLKQHNLHTYINAFFHDFHRQTWFIEGGEPFDIKDIPGFVTDLFARYYAYLENNCDQIPAIIETYKNMARHTGIPEVLSEEAFIDLLIKGSISHKGSERVNYIKEHIWDFSLRDNISKDFDIDTLGKIEWIQQAVMCSRPDHLLPILIAQNPALQGFEDSIMALPKIGLLNMMMTVNQCVGGILIEPEKFDPPQSPWYRDLFPKTNQLRIQLKNSLSYEVKPDLNGLKVKMDFTTSAIDNLDHKGTRFGCILEIPVLVPFRPEDKAFTYTVGADLTFGDDTTDEEVHLLAKTLSKQD